MSRDAPTAAASYTCAACQVRLCDADAQRAHYRSEWHRYNLRRRADSLPPVAEAVHAARLAGAAASNSLPLKAACEEYACAPCRKVFLSANAHANHVASRRHRALAAAGDDAPVRVKRREEKTRKATPMDDLDSDADEEDVAKAFAAHLAVTRRLRPTECLFCAHEAPSQRDAFEHMRGVHALYVPDAAYVVDAPGMMAYLADKVSVAHLCLACPPGRAPFASLEAVRQHMADAGHAKIRFDESGADELADFYDYALPDDGDEDFVDDSGDDGDATAIESPDGTQLLLPSGRVVRSRASARGRLRPSDSAGGDSGAEPASEAAGTLVVPRLGDVRLASAGATPAQIRQHFVAQHAQQSASAAASLSLGVRNNGMQHHFRLQLRQ